ncbi:hypothetical protein K2X33_04600 [bacterium]|nr:hypothetical protein [bacterium]
MNRWFLFLGLGALALATGCTSTSAMQTARVVNEGEYRFLLAGGLFQTNALSSTDPDKVYQPYFEGATRFGFAPSWDLGLKVTAPGMVTGDLKAELYTDEAWAFSLGAGVGYLFVKDRGADDYFDQDVIDVLVPLYLSYDFSDAFSAYISPRAVWRSFKKEYWLLGAAAGVRIGNALGLILEFSGAHDLQSDFSQYQAGVGFFFGSPHARNNP